MSGILQVADPQRYHIYATANCSLVAADDVFKDVSAYDKTLVEKLQLVEQLEEGEKKSVFSIIDSLAAKKKLKDTLSNALSIAQ